MQVGLSDFFAINNPAALRVGDDNGNQLVFVKVNGIERALGFTIGDDSPIKMPLSAALLA